MRLGRVQIASLAGLSTLAAGFGLLWGWTSLPPTETAVIEAMAARYVAQTGGMATDCAARPGPDGQAWITVFCDGEMGRFAYPVDRQGRLIAIAEGGA